MGVIMEHDFTGSHVSQDVCVKQPQTNTIVLSSNNKNIMSISEKGIVIHRENMPEWTPDQFVREFCRILELHTNVKFEITNGS